MGKTPRFITILLPKANFRASYVWVKQNTSPKASNTPGWPRQISPEFSWSPEQKKGCLAALPPGGENED